MYGGVSHKTKQFLSLLIKLSIVIGASYFVYNRLVNNDELDLEVLWKALEQHQILTWDNLGILLGFTALNWIFEITKWKQLVAVVKRISFVEATEQSLGALTASLFTPNRIGEYGAKAIYFAKQQRKRILLLNLLGNVAQMTITTVLGIVGFGVFIWTYEVDISYYRVLRILFIVVLVGALAVTGTQHSRLKIKGFSFQRIRGFLKKIGLSRRFKILLLSLIRYVIFSHQFYFLLILFKVEIPYAEAMMCISSMYLIASVVPTLFIFDVVIKGSAAVWLFGILGVNEGIVLCISMLMWIFNFVIPSIFGSYYVLNFGPTQLSFDEPENEAS